VSFGLVGCAARLLVEKLVDRRIHDLVERLSRVADKLHVRLRLEQLDETVEAVLVRELDDVLGLPGRDDVYLSHGASIRPVSASATVGRSSAQEVEEARRRAVEDTVLRLALWLPEELLAALERREGA
jgi:hypothetical protein